MSWTSITGYWNRFDRSNGYKRHLYRAARGLQSAEMNEIHDYLHDNFKMFADFLVGDAVVLQGGSINVNVGSTSCVVEAGAFIVEGYVLELLARGNIVITAVGTYNIGAIIKQEVITELEDPNLKDPATGTRNYNEPGAAAGKITARWGLDSETDSDEEFYLVHQIIDGIVVSGKASESPEGVADSVKELVARYDRDSNGNYIVEGYGVSHESDDAVNEEHVMIVDSGKAHVYGYEIDRTSRSKVRFRYGTDETSVSNEPVSFTGDGWYDLRKTPIAALSEVNGQVREQDESMTRGTGWTDELGLQPVLDIEVVSSAAGGGGIVYTEGTDWQEDGNYIDWNMGGSAPASGSTYYITYIYDKDITSTVVISGDKTQIQILGIINGTTVQVDYSYYLPRYDKIIIDRSGALVVIEGTANQPDLIQPPFNTQGLPLADVLIEYGVTPVCVPAGTRAYQMKDIEYIMGVLSEVRYNMARMAQVTDAGLKDPSTDKKNMYVDAFHDDDLIDAGQDNNTAIADGHLQASIDWTPNVVCSGSLIHLPFSEVVRDVMKNTAYSKTRKVNELDCVVNEQTMTISPKSFQWISSFSGSGSSPEIVNDPGAEIPTAPGDGGPVTITVTGGVFGSSELVALYIDGSQVLSQGTDTLAGSIDPDIFADGQHYWTADVAGDFSFSFDIPSGVRACRDMDDSIVIESVGYTTRVGAVDSFYAVARLGKTAFNSIQGDLESMKASINVNTARVGSLQRGVAHLGRGLVSVTAGGGQRTSSISRTTAGQVSQAYPTTFRTRAISTSYIVSATSQVEQKLWDPLAQTFIPEETAFLTSGEVYITTKPANVDNLKNYVEVAIHGVLVGIPDRLTQLASKFIRTEDLTEGAWNKFTFDDPIVLEAGVEYAIIVHTPDTGTYIRVSEIGQWNLESGNVGWMKSQPHTGVLLQSANRSTWTAISKEDMTFKLNQANFSAAQSDYQIDANPLGLAVTNITDLNLVAGYDEYPGTKASFYCILVDRSNERHELTLNKTIVIDEYSGIIKTYMNLTTDNASLSPVIDGDVTLAIGAIQFPATYTSRAFEIDLTDGVSDQIKVWLDRYEPANTTITVQLQTSGNGSAPGHWTDIPQQPGETPIGEGWYDTEYKLIGLKALLGSGAIAYDVRIRLVLDVTGSNITTKSVRPQVENLRAYIAIEA